MKEWQSWKRTQWKKSQSAHETFWKPYIETSNASHAHTKCCWNIKFFEEFLLKSMEFNIFADIIVIHLSLLSQWNILCGRLLLPHIVSSWRHIIFWFLCIFYIEYISVYYIFPLSLTQMHLGQKEVYIHIYIYMTIRLDTSGSYFNIMFNADGVMRSHIHRYYI